MLFLFNYLHDCRCAPCCAVRFLKAKLSREDFQILLDFAKKAERSISSISGELSIDSLHGFSSRTITHLKANGICTIDDLINKTEAELLELPNIGNRTLGYITEALDIAGRKLAKVPSA